MLGTWRAASSAACACACNNARMAKQKSQPSPKQLAAQTKFGAAAKATGGKVKKGTQLK